MSAPFTPLWPSGSEALVVDPAHADRALLVSTLTAAGLVVTPADDFRAARARLVRRPPAVLITELRLGLYNGLHLASIGHWMRKEMIVVVTSQYTDLVLASDAEALGATFLQKPVTAERLLAALGSEPSGRPTAVASAVCRRGTFPPYSPARSRSSYS